MHEATKVDPPTLDDLVRRLSATVEASGYLITRLGIVNQQLGTPGDDSKTDNGESVAGSVYFMLTQAVEQATHNKTRLEGLIRHLERSVGVNQPVAVATGSGGGNITSR